ncbi:alpha/beta fold hydrolase [Allokutzneria sp. NRRL B-24872]|uniref:alpha/beta fold hydrolase n=1 Tax=Allokutzneria sp. NRRL B-24872 TaxID=1137961 RepID=UPI000A37EEAC|nr:alpha/beta hydrolase [Allokutzneria sp. NRRL B-24872]
MEERWVSGTDGTKIRAWSSGRASPPVLLCAGLGTPTEAWPSLTGPDASVRVHGWHYRGTFDSERPADEERIQLADHVGDALAVLDDAGIRRCVVIGWSLGVTVATELARLHPERVAGVMLIGGAPGAFFDDVLGVIGLPKPLSRVLARGGTQALRWAGPLLDAVAHRLPAHLLPGNEAIRVSAQRFLRHDWRWWFTLALALGDTGRQDLSALSCPVTVLAGRYDPLADPRGSWAAAGPLPQARLRELPCSHFVPLEAPEVLASELDLLVERAEAVRDALDYADPRPLTPRSPESAYPGRP